MAATKENFRFVPARCEHFHFGHQSSPSGTALFSPRRGLITYIDRLPTSLWWDIFSLLPMHDLKNLRSTCGWFEHQAYRPYIKRKIHCLGCYIVPSKHKLWLLQLVRNHPGMAAAVHYLGIEGHLTYNASPDPERYVRGPRPDSSEICNFSPILDGLINLETVALRGLDGESLARCFPSIGSVTGSFDGAAAMGIWMTEPVQSNDGISTQARMLPAADDLAKELPSETLPEHPRHLGPHITTLQLWDNRLTIGELVRILTSFQRSLKTVSIGTLPLTNGEWQVLLHILRSLSLDALFIASSIPNVGFSYIFPKCNKWFNAKNGKELYIMRGNSMEARGGTAVRAALTRTIELRKADQT